MLAPPFLAHFTRPATRGGGGGRGCRASPALDSQINDLPPATRATMRDGGALHGGAISTEKWAGRAQPPARA